MTNSHDVTFSLDAWFDQRKADEATFNELENDIEKYGHFKKVQIRTVSNVCGDENNDDRKDRFAPL